jgi:hypothetical protein
VNRSSLTNILPTTNNVAVIRNLTAGRDYFYVIRARNKCGWGVYSSALKVRISPPPKVRMVVSAIKGCSVNIAWSAYSSEGGSVAYSIEKFDVKIKGENGEYHKLPDNCDTKNSRSCIVTMNVLSEAPYNLTKGKLIVARGKAHSSFGKSPYGVSNSFVRMKPLAKTKL